MLTTLPTKNSLGSVLNRSFANSLFSDDSQRVSGVTRLVQTAKRLSVPSMTGKSKRSSILAHMRENLGHVVDGNELFAVAGTSEYGRRVRELRAAGWRIYCGARQPTRGEARMLARHGLRSTSLARNEYVLLSLRNAVSHRA